MESLITLMRRLLVLLAITAAGGLAYSWWRQRTADEVDGAEWPPLRRASDPFPTPDTPASASAPSASATATTVDASPEPWVEPAADGSCPLTHPVKLKVASGIFHVPGGRFHDRTKADRCYSTAEAAEADGYRRSKS